jgi:hypothetical protein
MPDSPALHSEVELTIRTEPVVELTHAVTVVDVVTASTITVAVPDLVESCAEVAMIVADPDFEGV